MSLFYTLSIKTFLNKPPGYSEEFELSGNKHFDEFLLSSEITLQVKLLKLDNGINVAIENLETKAPQTCRKCLKHFTEKIKILYAERIYYFHRPKETDLDEIFLINLKTQKIDLTELLRQEILLHLPIYQVCSKSCKGLCHTCSKNLNEGKCQCEPRKPAAYKPFQNLKSLL